MGKERNFKDKPIGQFVAEDQRTAKIFNVYGIDFYCHGEDLLSSVCKNNDLDLNQILIDLEMITSEPYDGVNYKDIPLDELTDCIQSIHHTYIERQLPVISEHLDTLCESHGKMHEGLFMLRSLFNDFANELNSHIKKEELILFPFIKELQEAANDKKNKTKVFGTVKNPISIAKDQHDNEDERFRFISQLTKNFSGFIGKCNTYNNLIKLLDEFEFNLHTHIHLENNILFPKAIELERKFCAA